MQIKKTALVDEIGGLEGCRLLSIRFHELIAADPDLREVFPRNLAPTTEWLSLFLVENLGGPPLYRSKRGKTSLICRHAHLRIGSEMSESWQRLMSAAMEDVGISPQAREALQGYFRETAQTLTDPLLPYYQMPLDELRLLLSARPELLQSDLVGEAASRWDVSRVGLLLEMGASPNALERLAHGPLYRATNAQGCPIEDGVAVVQLLLHAGADFNQASGPSRSTPLHNTARRGHVALAETLLDAGADLERLDSKGATALQRAINCRKHEMVSFLLSRGARPTASR